MREKQTMCTVKSGGAAYDVKGMSRAAVGGGKRQLKNKQLVVFACTSTLSNRGLVQSVPYSTLWQAFSDPPTLARKLSQWRNQETDT